MEEAAAGHDSAMVAVLGFPREQLLEAVRESQSLGTVVIANYNCPGQLVLGETRRRCSRLPPWQRPGEPAGACPCGSPAPSHAPDGSCRYSAGGTVPEDLLPGTENSRAL